jgi:PRTRC genetic system protein E
MFKTLAAFAATSPVIITIFPATDGEVRAFITQKKDDSNFPRKTIDLNITGTPEELDAQLPIAIAESFAAAPKTIAEQVASQAVQAEPLNSSSGAADEAKTPETPRKQKTLKPATSEKMVAPKVTPLLDDEDESQDQDTSISADPEANMPEKARASKTLKKAKKPEPNNSEKRQQCLDDLLALICVYGPRITRREYAKSAKTGRSFERIFGTWEAFLKVALEIAPPPNGDDCTMPLQLQPAAPETIEPPQPQPTPPSEPVPTPAIELLYKPPSLAAYGITSFSTVPSPSITP